MPPPPALLPPVPALFNEGRVVVLLLPFFGLASSMSVPLSWTIKESSSESTAEERREEHETLDEERLWETVGIDESEGTKNSSSSLAWDFRAAEDLSENSYGDKIR